MFGAFITGIQVFFLQIRTSRPDSKKTPSFSYLHVVDGDLQKVTLVPGVPLGGSFPFLMAYVVPHLEQKEQRLDTDSSPLQGQASLPLLCNIFI